MFGSKIFENFSISKNSAGPRSPWGSSTKPNSGGDKTSQSNNQNNSQNSGNSGQNFGQKKGPQNNNNDEDIFEKITKFFDKIFSNISSIFDKNNDLKSPKSVVGLVILAITTLWLSLGIYKVNSDENALVLYFGKFYKVATPGLNYYVPYPFGQVIKKSVTAVNSEEFGFSSNLKNTKSKTFDEESLMLTGDENIVDIEFEVQWQISDIYDFVFNIAEPNQTIRKSAESAMREIIARTPIAAALSDGKGKIEQETKELLQQTLDSYKSGVRVVLVQLRRVDPPIQVIDAFRDVQTAKADKEKEINEAQAYANDIIPRARGLASQMEEQSQAYAKEVVANAEGEAGRFISVYNQYVKAKQVTKKRIYLETMERIYGDMDKVFIDKSVARAGVMPYLPLNDISNSAAKNSSANSTVNSTANSSATSAIVKPTNSK